MTKASKATRCFLEFSSDQREWDIPRKYIKEMDEELGSLPVTFLLPWPVDFIPAVGNAISLPDIFGRFAGGVVTKIEYQSSLLSGMTVYVEMAFSAEDNDRPFSLGDLVSLGERGGLFEGEHSIRKTLKRLGIPTTLKGFRKWKRKSKKK